MSREDLLDVNAKIIKSVVPGVVKHSPHCILIVVTNPLDAMVHLAHRISGFPKQRVIGMAGVLDTARFRTFLSEALHADVNGVEALVLGSHGDLMVPLISHCKVNGIPISKMLPAEKINQIVQRVKDGGAEIVNLLKTGSAFFAPGLSIAEMAESILKDKKKTLPCSVLLEGEYGISGIFIGVPVVLGKKGAEKVVELELSTDERELLHKSAGHIKELVRSMDKYS
jgi:malate dehydrogenase